MAINNNLKKSTRVLVEKELSSSSDDEESKSDLDLQVFFWGGEVESQQENENAPEVLRKMSTTEKMAQLLKRSFGEQ